MLFLSCSQKQHYSVNGYTIVKIDSVENVYIVYAEKADSLYKIISKKSDKGYCQPMKVGRQYNLALDSYFLPEELHVKNRMTGISYEGVLINIERDGVVSDIFTTQNLNGLCYFE